MKQNYLTAEYTFLGCAHGIFSRINHILVHKTNLSTFKKTEIIQSIFSDPNGMKLESTAKKTKNFENPQCVEFEQYVFF